MFSPKNPEFDQTSKAKVPFSWELKPGVSRRNSRSVRDQLQWKLTPPPCPQVEYYSEEVLESPLVICSFTPSGIGKSSRFNLSSFKKKEVDPFLEAYRKCLESPMRNPSSMGRNVGGADQDRYTKAKKKSLLLWLWSLWSKYSCRVGTDGRSTPTRFRKPKSNQRINSTK
uniref:Uncharacterized protein n=2 Tax=Noccaea caerulescens TaxID=107243 RepID=A0A1J3D6R3_NOCCA